MLDNILGHVERVDLIKIDVEGREADVLRGAKNILAKFHPPIVAEYLGGDSILKGDGDVNFIEDLAQSGYTVKIIEPDGTLLVVEGTGQALSVAIERYNVTGGDHIDVLLEHKDGRRL